jgi:hypothetical protein
MSLPLRALLGLFVAAIFSPVLSANILQHRVRPNPTDLVAGAGQCTPDFAEALRKSPAPPSPEQLGEKELLPEQEMSDGTRIVFAIKRDDPRGTVYKLHSINDEELTWQSVVELRSADSNFTADAWMKEYSPAVGLFWLATGGTKLKGGAFLKFLASCAHNYEFSVGLHDISNLSPLFQWKTGQSFYMRYGWTEDHKSQPLNPDCPSPDSCPVCGPHQNMSVLDLAKKVCPCASASAAGQNNAISTKVLDGVCDALVVDAKWNATVTKMGGKLNFATQGFEKFVSDESKQALPIPDLMTKIFGTPDVMTTDENLQPFFTRFLPGALGCYYPQPHQVLIPSALIPSP